MVSELFLHVRGCLFLLKRLSTTAVYFAACFHFVRALTLIRLNTSHRLIDSVVIWLDLENIRIKLNLLATKRAIYL